MSEAQETNRKETGEWLARQSFESCADTVSLDEMPNNDDSATRGISAGTWMRLCGVILQDDDKQLYEKFSDDESYDFYLGFVEDLAKFIDSEKAGLEVFEACHIRLLVCAHRYAKEYFPEESKA